MWCRAACALSVRRPHDRCESLGQNGRLHGVNARAPRQPPPGHASGQPRPQQPPRRTLCAVFPGSACLANPARPDRHACRMQNVRGVFSYGAESGTALLSSSAYPPSETSQQPGLAAGNPFAMSADRRIYSITPSSGPSPTAFMEYAAGRDPQKVLAELLPGSLESVPGSSGFGVFVGWDASARLPVPRSHGGGSSGLSGWMPPQSVAMAVEPQDVAFVLRAGGDAHEPVANAPPGGPQPPPPRDEPANAPRVPGLEAKEKAALAAMPAAWVADEARRRHAGWRRPPVGGRPVAEGMQDVSDSSSDDGSARSRRRGEGEGHSAALRGRAGRAVEESAELAAEGLEALPAMVSGVERPTSGSGSASADEHVPSAGVGSRPTSATETSRMTVSGPVTADSPASLHLRADAGPGVGHATQRSDDGTAGTIGTAGTEEAPPDGPVASFMLDSLQTDSHSELTMALLPDGGGGRGAAAAVATVTGGGTSGFGSPLKHGSGGAAAAAAAKHEFAAADASSPAAGPGAYKLLLQPLPESFSSIPEAWSSHRSSGAGSAPNSLLNSSVGVAGSSALGHHSMSTGGGGNVEVHMSHDTLSTAQTSTTGTDPRQTLQQMANRQILSPEQVCPRVRASCWYLTPRLLVTGCGGWRWNECEHAAFCRGASPWSGVSIRALIMPCEACMRQTRDLGVALQILFTMESDPDLLESFASTDAAAAAAAVREIIPEALTSVSSSSHLRAGQPGRTAAGDRVSAGAACDTPGTRGVARAGSGSGSSRSRRPTAGDAFGSALLPGHSAMQSPAELKQALALPLEKLSRRVLSDPELPVAVGSKRRRGAGGGCGSCMSISAEMAYLARLRRPERAHRLEGNMMSDVPEGVHWVVATVASGAIPWLEDLLCATPRISPGCGARLWQACSRQGGSVRQASSTAPLDASIRSGTASDVAAAASDVAPLPPIEERYHYSYAVAAAGGRVARGGLFAGMLGKCGLQTLSWDTETQGSGGGRGSRMGGRVGLTSLEGLPTFRSMTESSASGNSSAAAGTGAPSVAGGVFALRDVHIRE